MDHHLQGGCREGRPTVSLIISTYNRPQALEQVLASVAGQQVMPQQVLVADDGSGPETAQVVRRWHARLGDRVRHCWQPDEGFRLSAARNLAIREAEGELLIFVDGDCLLRPDFVQAHQWLAEPGFATAGNRVLLGRQLTEQVEAGSCNPVPWRLWQWLGAWRRGDVNDITGLLRLPGQWWRRPKGQPWRLFKGCNMALWRDDIIRLNGFEEEIAGWGFEDTDLILRWFNLGGRLKNGRFATTVLHLWHREEPRDAAEENERRARLAGSRGATVAERGLAQQAGQPCHQSPGEG